MFRNVITSWKFARFVKWRLYEKITKNISIFVKGTLLSAKDAEITIAKNKNRITNYFATFYVNQKEMND